MRVRPGDLASSFRSSCAHAVASFVPLDRAGGATSPPWGSHRRRGRARRLFGALPHVGACRAGVRSPRERSDDGGSRFRRQGGDRHRSGRRPRAGALAAARQPRCARGRQRRGRCGRRQRQRRGAGSAGRRRDQGRRGRSRPRHQLGRDARGWRRHRADRARHVRPHRHRREQRGHPARQELPQHGTRPRRPRARRPPARRVLRDAAGVGAHARAGVRSHRGHRVVGRTVRQLRSGQLRRRQDGPRRPRPRARPGGRALQHQGQCDRARPRARG